MQPRLTPRLAVYPNCHDPLKLREYSHYANNNKKIHTSQSALNDSVLRINRETTAFNESNGARTTWMSETVHPPIMEGDTGTSTTDPQMDAIQLKTPNADGSTKSSRR